MDIDRASLAVWVALYICLATILPGSATQPQVQVTGLITVRNAETMNMKTVDGKILEVVLNPDTKIEKPQGAFGFRKKELNVTALVPGMNVTVQGLQYENNQLIAKTVTLSKQSFQSLKAAEPGSGGMSLQQADLSNYAVKATWDAHFAAGSALLSDADKAGLLHLAENAAALPGYMITVQGFADFAGSNSYDQQLSRDRAEAVIDFLRTSGKIAVTHIVAPGGMTAPAGASESPQGVPQTGRAEVKVLIKSAGK